MYFRFGVAILLVVAIAVLGVAVEKSMLGFRREITRQQYRKDVLKEEHERLRLRTQQLGAPTRVLRSLESQDQSPSPSVGTPGSGPQAKRRPLLRWQRRSSE